jgi:alpha-ketoglutarate-dependent taurine dioxygenase
MGMRRLTDDIKFTNLHIDDKKILIAEPNDKHCDIVSIAQRNKKLLGLKLQEHGAILFRGFENISVDVFSKFIEASSNDWATYREPATPRRAIQANIYTSTEYPARHEIPLHNENSHCSSWPLKIFFYCAEPATNGGQTPLADCRQVLKNIPEVTLQKFLKKRWRYVRHLGGDLGFGWQKVFGASSKKQVEEYCSENSMDFVWNSNGSLQISYLRDAVKYHPTTGDAVWFNHGLFFNPISIEKSVRDILLSTYSKNELPYNTFYGDGEEIDESTLMVIKEAYKKATIAFNWQAGDILMLDNMLFAHGRKSFSGPRKILVGLTDPISS